MFSKGCSRFNNEKAAVRKLALDGMASAVYERLKQLIDEFDHKLDQSHEVGVKLVSFGQEVVFHVEGLGYWDPSLIVFDGRLPDGLAVQLVQHVSQLSFMLMVLPRQDPATPKQPMGFHTPDDHPDTAASSGT